jgi:broad specificity phosphatase PhoE
VSALRLWLVRHAPVRAPGVAGWTDAPCDLSDAGTLDHLAARLPEAPVVSSDLARARATADRIAGARPRLPHEPDLRETHFGAWEGMTADAIAAADPALSRAFWDGEAAAPGGEGFADMAARACAALDRLAQGRGRAADEPRDLIAVAHMGPILAALARAADLAPARALAFRIDPLSVTRLDLLPGGFWRVEGVNLRRLP